MTQLSGWKILLDPINDFFWSNGDHYKTEALQEASAHLQKIQNAKYILADLDKVVQIGRHLTNDKKMSTACPIWAYMIIYFDGTLGT